SFLHSSVLSSFACTFILSVYRIFVFVFPSSAVFFFFFNVPAPTAIYTLSLHDALPIYFDAFGLAWSLGRFPTHLYTLFHSQFDRSEEHTSELQSRENLVCRLLLEKKKKKKLYPFLDKRMIAGT